MPRSESVTSFTADPVEFASRRGNGENIVLAPAVHARSEVKELVAYYRAIASESRQVNVLNTVGTLLTLRSLRQRFASRQRDADALLEDVAHRMGEAVEGTSTIELSWIQGFTTAAGMSALLSLQSAVASASEELDRKSAYALACFSLYVAVFSLAATIILGVMSLK